MKDIKNLTIDVSLQSLCKWPSLEKSLEQGFFCNLYLDFGFSHKEMHFLDEMAFSSYQTAIEECLKIISPYKNQIQEMILYQGNGYFGEAISSYEDTRENYSSWSEETFGKVSFSSHTLHIFSIRILMEYLHRLSACIEDISVATHFSGIKKSPAHLAELFAKEYFPYIRLGGLKDPYLKKDTSVGLVVPKLGHMNYDLFNQITEILHQKNITYSLMQEDFICDSWQGIDDLIVLSDTMQTNGFRMLEGFCAALGRIVSAGKTSLPVEEVISFQSWIKPSE